MSERIELIIFQNWVLMGLLATLIALLATCTLVNYRRLRSSDLDLSDPDRPDFAKLGESCEIDCLLQESETHLKKYRNSTDALYFRAKALLQVGEQEQALECLERLANIEPALRRTITQQIADIKATSE